MIHSLWRINALLVFFQVKTNPYILSWRTFLNSAFELRRPECTASITSLILRFFAPPWHISLRAVLLLVLLWHVLQPHSFGYCLIPVWFFSRPLCLHMLQISHLKLKMRTRWACRLNDVMYVKVPAVELDLPPVGSHCHFPFSLLLLTWPSFYHAVQQLNPQSVELQVWVQVPICPSCYVTLWLRWVV